LSDTPCASVQCPAVRDKGLVRAVTWRTTAVETATNNDVPLIMTLRTTNIKLAQPNLVSPM